MPANAGRILEFSYTGPVLSITPDSLYTYVRNTFIKISPNPAKNILFVKSIRNISKPLHYHIFDAAGKLLLSGTSNNDNFSINVQKLAAGMYFIKLYNAYQINLTTQKFVIK